MNKGYGVAIRTLLQAARERNTDIMVTIDSDGQHNPDQIPDIVKPVIEESFDMVIGSRFINHCDAQRVPLYGSLGIKTITKLAQSASYNHITDSQTDSGRMVRMLYGNWTYLRMGCLYLPKYCLKRKKEVLP
jgi:glycosyltransferase involved in cell wall biosynthesis